MAPPPVVTAAKSLVLVLANQATVALFLEAYGVVAVHRFPEETATEASETLVLVAWEEIPVPELSMEAPTECSGQSPEEAKIVEFRGEKKAVERGGFWETPASHPKAEKARETRGTH